MVQMLGKLLFTDDHALRNVVKLRFLSFIARKTLAVLAAESTKSNSHTP